MKDTTTPYHDASVALNLFARRTTKITTLRQRRLVVIAWMRIRQVGSARTDSIALKMAGCIHLSAWPSLCGAIHCGITANVSTTREDKTGVSPLRWHELPMCEGYVLYFRCPFIGCEAAGVD